MTLGSSRPVEKVLILQDTGTVARADVEGRTPSGDWITLGTVSGAATQVAAGGRQAPFARPRGYGSMSKV